MTFGKKLAENKGVGPGFDALRIGLAGIILFIHCALLWANHPESEALPLFPYSPLARWAFNFAPLPMFFALSGFLVAGSAERLSLPQFLINRLLRIVPALAVEIILSALVLGPLLTVLPLSAYFADPHFRSYFLNIIGNIHYELPGLFLTNPEPGVVNGSLWTVPHEVSCYIVLTCCVLLGIFKHRILLLAVTLALFSISIFVFFCDQFGVRLPYHETLTYVFVVRGAARLVPVFMVGLLFYRYRERIPYRLDLAFASGISFVILAAFGSPEWAVNPIFSFVTAPLLTYVIVYAGLSSTLKLAILKRGDYSYGIYLYGFPLQQMLIAVFPAVKNVALFFLMSLAMSLSLAVFSWHFVEKPILAQRRRFSLAAKLHTSPQGSDQAVAIEAEPGAAARCDKSSSVDPSLVPIMNQSKAAVLIE
jgi:peptidoglycan/LPS O-acetylase OafA/YrhL